MPDSDGDVAPSRALHGDAHVLGVGCVLARVDADHEALSRSGRPFGDGPDLPGEGAGRVRLVPHEIDADEIATLPELGDPRDAVEIPLRIVVPTQRGEKSDGDARLLLHRRECGVESAQGYRLEDVAERQLHVANAHALVVECDALEE